MITSPGTTNIPRGVTLVSFRLNTGSTVVNPGLLVVLMSHGPSSTPRSIQGVPGKTELPSAITVLVTVRTITRFTDIVHPFNGNVLIIYTKRKSFATVFRSIQEWLFATTCQSARFKKLSSAGEAQIGLNTHSGSMM